MAKVSAVKKIVGKPKSGRIWKSGKKKFSNMINVKSLKLSWVKKMKLKNEHKALVTQTSKLKEVKKQQEELRKKRRAEKIQRKKENEQKSEIVQIIRDNRKIKRMSKRQLRRIETRDTTI